MLVINVNVVKEAYVTIGFFMDHALKVICMFIIVVRVNIFTLYEYWSI